MFSAEASIGQFMRVSDVAKELNLSTQTVRTLIRRGDLAPASRFGGQFLIPRASFENYLKSATVNAPARAAA
jgi:excisionase family DNA binding protein